MRQNERIASGGAGAFLDPPTYPQHAYHVECDLRRRPENRGMMSLEYASTCEYISAGVRVRAKRMLAKWQAPPIDSPEIVDWRLEVLGYFAGCYADLSLPEADRWNAGNLLIPKLYPAQAEKVTDPVNQHAGVRHIRRFYPDWTPTDEDFARAKWGN